MLFQRGLVGGVCDSDDTYDCNSTRVNLDVEVLYVVEIVLQHGRSQN